MAIQDWHPGQLAVLWVATLVIVVTLGWQRAELTARIVKSETWIFEYMKLDRSYRAYLTQEQKAQADAFDREAIAKTSQRVRSQKTIRWLLDITMFSVFSVVLVITWRWFGNRMPKKEVEPDAK